MNRLAVYSYLTWYTQVGNIRYDNLLRMYYIVFWDPDFSCMKHIILSRTTIVMSLELPPLNINAKEKPL